MAVTCPHCRRPAIAVRRKLYAVDALPARCPDCGGLSYVGFSLRIMLLLAVPEILAVVLIIGWDANRTLAAVGVVVLLGVFAAYHALAPLVPISPRRVRFSRWTYVIGWLLILGIIVYASLQSTQDIL